MSVRLTRRAFLETAALGATAGLASPAPAQDQMPKMSIVSWSKPENDPEAIEEEATRLTQEAIKALGGMSRFVSKGDVVWVKPNIGWDRRPEQAANTNPHVVGTLVRLCYEAGAKKVCVSDYATHDERRTFVRSQIQQAATEAGAEVFYLDKRKFKNMDLGGTSLKNWPIYVDYVECDKRINVPIAKTHSLAGLTLGIKNLMGIIGDPRNRLHQNLGPSLADIASFVPSHLTVLDAIRIMIANGPSGGSLQDVARKDTIAAGIDPVAIDAFGSTLFGMKPDALGTTKAAAKRGLGTIDFEALNPVRLTIS